MSTPTSPTGESTVPSSPNLEQALAALSRVHGQTGTPDTVDLPTRMVSVAQLQREMKVRHQGHLALRARFEPYALPPEEGEPEAASVTAGGEDDPVLREGRGIRRPASSLPPKSPAPEPPALLRPLATCPRCGARPAMRIAPVFALILKHAPLSASDRVATYQCQRRGCGAVYDLTADAFQRAA